VVVRATDPDDHATPTSAAEVAACIVADGSGGAPMSALPLLEATEIILRTEAIAITDHRSPGVDHSRGARAVDLAEHEAAARPRSSLTSDGELVGPAGAVGAKRALADLDAAGVATAGVTSR